MTETVVTVQNPESKHGKPGVENGNAGNVFAWVEINYKYFKTVPGILKLVQLVSFIQTIISDLLYIRHCGVVKIYLVLHFFENTACD